MSYQIGVINSSWPHNNNGTNTNISSNRVVTIENINKKGYSLRLELGNGIGGDWNGPIAMFYDSSTLGNAYACETLQSHYNNSEDRCDPIPWSGTGGVRGGTIVEALGGTTYANHGNLYPTRLCLMQKTAQGQGDSRVCFGSYASSSQTPYGRIAYLLMQPLAQSNQSSIDSHMPNATTSNTYRAYNLIDQNPYASAKYFSVDLLLINRLDPAFSNPYQSIENMCQALGNLSSNGHFIYYIGMGAKYASSPSSSSTYVRSNMRTTTHSSMNPNGLTANNTANDSSLNLIVGGRVATFYDAFEQHYLIGFIRTALQISDVSKIYPIISVATSSGFVDLAKANISHIKYMGYTANSTYLNSLGDYLPSGRDSYLKYLYTFYIDVRMSTAFHNLLNGNAAVGRGLIIRGCKYQ